MQTQNLIKIHPFVLKVLRKNTCLHKSRAITMLFLNEFSLFAIPNHSSLISMAMQSLKKIGQKLLKLVRKRSAEGRTDRHSNFKIFGGYDIIPRHFCVAGYKKMTCAPSEDSGQPGHPPSLIRVFAVHMKKAWVLCYPLSAHRSLWANWADAHRLIWVFAGRTCHFVMRRLMTFSLLAIILLFLG